MFDSALILAFVFIELIFLLFFHDHVTIITFKTTQSDSEILGETLIDMQCESMTNVY